MCIFIFTIFCPSFPSLRVGFLCFYQILHLSTFLYQKSLKETSLPWEFVLHYFCLKPISMPKLWSVVQPIHNSILVGINSNIVFIGPLQCVQGCYQSYQRLKWLLWWSWLEHQKNENEWLFYKIFLSTSRTYHELPNRLLYELDLAVHF